MQHKPLVVGLTGGIGSGKSLACSFFEKLGVTVVDADIVARAVVEPGSPALNQIIEEFGQQVIDSEGHLDRAALRRLVFTDPSRRRKLEAITHPRINAQMTETINDSDGPYVIVCIPLLVENGRQQKMDHVVVVDAPVAVQLERVMRRDNLTESEVEAIMRAQADREQRLAQADDVLLNDADATKLEMQVTDLHEKLLGLSKRAETLDH